MKKITITTIALLLSLSLTCAIAGDRFGHDDDSDSVSTHKYKKHHGRNHDDDRHHGEKKAKLGPCVRDCVHAFNPSLAYSADDQFLSTDQGPFWVLPSSAFNAKVCVDYCKEEISAESSCLFTVDQCCNTYFQDTDPDCAVPLPPVFEPVSDPAVGGGQPVLNCTTNAFGFTTCT
jgi:hypothetical protein